MKYCGNIGFAMTVERDPGIWVDTIVEKRCFGDVIKNSRRWETGDKVNDDLQVNNQISIVADSFCQAHLFQMKYITWFGTAWKVSTVDIAYPRIIITLGGVWNGSRPQEEPDEPPAET